MTAWPNEVCQWCGAGATDRISIGRRRGRAVYAYACREHAQRLAPAPEPEKTEPVVEERTEPLCGSCFAEITWISLPRNEKRMPVDRAPLHTKDPRVSMVLVDARKPIGVVLKKTDIDSGAAARRIQAGARLHLSHHATCPSAKSHRRREAARAA